MADPAIPLRALLVLASALAAPGCGRVEEDVTLVFPSEAARSATTEVAVSAFVPIVIGADGETPSFVGCDRVGVFPPARIVDANALGGVRGLRQVLQDRARRAYPFEGDWTTDFPGPDGGDPLNPWGAVMVLVEARGAARDPEADGAETVATILSACTCMRKNDASHPDRALDLAIEEACPKIGTGAPAREIVLGPVAPPEFRLARCGPARLAAPRGERVSPGPAVCLEAVTCEDSRLATDCFACDQPCDELADLGRVPVLFEPRSKGGGAAPAVSVVLTDRAGRAEGVIRADDCGSGLGVGARVLGRRGEPIDFDLGCVDPVSGFECVREIELPLEREPVALGTIPGSGGARDVLAVLSGDGASAYLEVLDPGLGGAAPLDSRVYEGETARSVLGFHYDLGATPAEHTRPALAVATSTGGALRLHLYEWVDGRLREHDGGQGVIREPCAQWTCGSLASCAGGAGCGAGEVCVDDLCVLVAPAPEEEAECTRDPPVRCECDMRLEFQSQVNLTTSDLDGDGRADLAVSASSDLPLTIYYSSRAGVSALYRAQGCTCSRFGQAPATVELVNLGGPGEGPLERAIDAVLGATGGAFIKYATRLPSGSVLGCGQPARFGDLVPIRHLARGRFGCDPFGGASCDPYEDVVIVSAESLGGGSFDDPGKIRVVFGAGQDLTADDRTSASPDAQTGLTPLVLPDRDPPRDPRAVAVGDLNGDGRDDLAVLYSASGEVHVWLGSGDRGLGEVSNGVVLGACEASAVPGSGCTPLNQLVVADIDGNGADDVAVACAEDDPPMPRLRIFSPFR